MCIRETGSYLLNDTFELSFEHVLEGLIILGVFN